ncbi:MAG: tripartite tricarboxylate transporter substrate binding protein [Deltaproteobacteria bacterium]|jgi:tripartite-type tricarboxylate transporter receptor subunit TctC|nr:tripartite tricarboxylate transporter substrate binding protein [Deltaproteobacteria bacterium]
MKKKLSLSLTFLLAGILVAGACLIPALSEAAAAKWPNRPVELIVPVRSGGDTDFYARTYAKSLEKELGATVTVINVEGAGGTVGAQQAASSPPNGYRVLFYHTGNLYVNKLLGATDLDQNAFAIACVAILDDTNVLVTNKNSGIANAQDFLTKARAEPGKYSVGTTISGFSFFTVCKMEAAGKFTLNPVDYGGAAAMIPAVMGNKVPLVANSYGVFKQYIDNGDLVPLVVSSEKRNPSFPNVPTVGELGMKDAAAARAYFFGFPKGTDPQIVKRLSDAVGAIQKNADYVADIKKAYCVEPFYRDATSAKKYLDDMWNDMVKYKDALVKK